MIKSWSDAAWEDFEYWTKQDKKTLKRILQLLKDIERNRRDKAGKKKGGQKGHTSVNLSLGCSRKKMRRASDMQNMYF